MSRLVTLSKTVYVLLALLSAGFAHANPSHHRYFTSSDGVRLHYIEAGKGERTLVFIPGWVMPAAVFEQQLLALSDQFRVLAFDPRSQGLSALTTLSHAPQRRMKDMDEFLKAAKVNHFILAGWSLGVLESLDYLANYNPKGLRGLILIDNSVGEGRPPGGRSSSFQQTMNDPKKREAYLRAFCKDIYREPPPPLLAQAVLDSAMRAPPKIAIQLMNQPYPREYWRETLEKQNVPVLYIARPWLKEQGAALLAKRPADLITVNIMEKPGHALFVDDPVGFNQATRSFSAAAFARKVQP
jgi:microsomal epoxide hydrolase